MRRPSWTSLVIQWWLFADTKQVRAMRLAESESGSASANPLKNLEFTDEEKDLYSRIRDAVPASLLRAVDNAPTGSDDLSVTCENKDKVDSADNPVYDDKFSKGHCDGKNGMNGGEQVSHGSLFRFLTVAHMFKLKSGHTVLDYGAGCGHQIDEVCRRHSCKAAAFDQIKGAADWAKKSLSHLKEYCVATGTNMPFKNETFDFVMSHGVLGNLKVEEQCELVSKKIPSILKPGGCAWFGYLGNRGNGEPDGATSSFVSVPIGTFLRDACIKKGALQGPWILPDSYLFGMSIWNTTYPNPLESSYSMFFCKHTDSTKQALKTQREKSKKEYDKMMQKLKAGGDEKSGSSSSSDKEPDNSSSQSSQDDKAAGEEGSGSEDEGED
eukprot:TRINITY_DN15184_c0_g2_i1.p1 TRINITY_DN15184_c0_g2~~TRINITY_DN15184_c0_g2_i1.p1  ORF type:complete len:382 (+),score=101.58 TRINITY_DN15184_c0_g2_i1:98-1243(+)